MKLKIKKYAKLLKMWRDPQYFLNWRDAKFSWEEKISLKHILDFLADLDLQSVGTYIQFLDPEWIYEDDPLDVSHFTIWAKVDDNIRYMDVFHYYDKEEGIKHFYSLYTKFGSHWAAVKAGLREIYYRKHLAGEKGFEKKPTNW